MRIMLINPQTPIDHPKVITLGPLYIGASLEKYGHDVKCIDMQAVKLSDEHILKEVEKWQSDIVGFSCYYLSYPYALRIASKIKEKHPDIKIVFGGPHPSFKPGSAVSEEAVDYVVIGEGEVTLPELVAAIENGGRLNKIHGIAYKSDGEIKLTPSRAVIEDLDSTAHPAWHLLDRKAIQSGVCGTIVTSRGCPFNCIFCSTSAFHGHKMRFHSVDWIIEEFDVVSGLFSRIMIGDDHFTIKKHRILKICEKLKEKGIETNFWAETRVDAVDYEIVRALKRAGCTDLCFGVESAEERILKTVGKKITVEQAKKAIRIVEEAGIEGSASFIVGLPGQTKESVMESTLKFVVETEPTEVVSNILMLCPGAPIYEEPEKYGVKVLGKSQFLTPFCTETMTWEDITNTYDELNESLVVLSLIKEKPKRLHRFILTEDSSI